MDHLLGPLTDFLSQHRIWAAVVLGLVTFFESLLFIGAFIPATALLVVAGGLVAAGVLDPVSVVLGCVIGAVLGDAISYEIGRRLGPGALRHRWFAPHRRKLARTRLYCRKFGVASIYVGRFFGPLRAFVPVVVGMLRMPQRRFQVANVCSAVVWVLAVLAPGYSAAFGLAKLEILGEADPLTLVAIAGAVLCVGALVAWRMLRWRAARRLPILDFADTGR